MAETPPPVTGGSGAVALIAQGFSQAEGSDEIGWGFLVENRDTARAIIESNYTITVYDASGVPIDGQDGALDTLLPGNRLGIGGSLYLPPGSVAGRIAVVVTPGQAVAPQFAVNLFADTLSYYDDALYPTATGVVRNDADRPLEDLQVFALAYDNAGVIVGGGSSFLSFVLPGAPTGVEVVVTSATPPSSIELFPMITSLTRYADQVRADAAAGTGATRPLFVDEQGFGALEAEHVGWGFIIQNPNEDLAADEIDYQVVAWAADGSVLGTSAASLGLLLPGARFGIGGELFLPDGPIVAKLSFQVLPRAFVTTRLQADDLTVDDPGVEDNANELSARGTLTNTLNTDLDSIDVYALAYDESGAIIGGGATVIDTIEANSTHRVTVPLVSLGTPARVEMYAVGGS